MYSQVGINTDNPHPSAIFDVTATDSGILIPRLDATAMEGIVDPATSLLVFNTSANAYFYYNGTSWVPVGSSQLRDNFKLIKSVADLSDEDTGTEYVLKTNTLYEINGLVVIDKPIDLNGAYLQGLDSNEDILVNGTGSSLFAGSEGGSIRTLTISSTGGSVFNLDDTTGDQTLLVNNTIFANASSIGTIEGFDVVFFSITQFINNDEGMTLTDLETLLISNIFWTSSNSGTFLSSTGSFSNYQIANGRIEVDAGEVGIDVSTNPTILNEALLSELSFVGSGDYVNGYTTGSYDGYNFNNRWEVRCAGIPNETDDNAVANFYNDNTLTTGFVQTINNNTAQEVEGTGSFAATNLFRFSVPANPNEVTYEGKESRFAQINVSMSVRVIGGIEQFYAFSIAVNDATVTETNSVVQITSDTDIQNISLNGVISISPGDVIKVFVQRLTDDETGADTDTLAVFSENLSIR